MKAGCIYQELILFTFAENKFITFSSAVTLSLERGWSFSSPECEGGLISSLTSLSFSAGTSFSSSSVLGVGCCLTFLGCS